MSRVACYVLRMRAYACVCINAQAGISAGLRARACARARARARVLARVR